MMTKITKTKLKRLCWQNVNTGRCRSRGEHGATPSYEWKQRLFSLVYTSTSTSTSYRKGANDTVLFDNNKNKSYQLYFDISIIHKQGSDINYTALCGPCVCLCFACVLTGRGPTAHCRG